LFSLFLALLTPLVSAQYEGVYSMFSFLFGTGEGAFVFLKAGVWIILFAIIFWSAKKMFSGSKGIATLFSIVVSLISIRFIPDEYIYYIASAYGVFGIILLILAIIGGTLLILNSYFPIKEHKAFGVVWALFYFFIAWVFHQLTNISTGISQIDELLPIASPWGKYISIVLGLACLYKAFSGRSKYAKKIPTKYKPSENKGKIPKGNKDDRDSKRIINDVNNWNDITNKLKSSVYVMNQQLNDFRKHIQNNFPNNREIHNKLYNYEKNLKYIEQRLTNIIQKIIKFENNPRVDKSLEKYIKIELNNIYNTMINLEKQIKEETQETGKQEGRQKNIRDLKHQYDSTMSNFQKKILPIQKKNRMIKNPEKYERIINAAERLLFYLLNQVDQLGYGRMRFLKSVKNGGIGNRNWDPPEEYINRARQKLERGR